MSSLEMQIKSVTVTSSLRQMCTPQSPDDGYFQEFLQGYKGHECTRENLTRFMGVAQTRQLDFEDAKVDLASIDQYASILARAYEGDGMKDPVAFLKSLSAQELEVIQHNKLLASEIDVDSLSYEGAYNLLLVDGRRADFNDDGIVEVGAARTLSFPPVNAPQSIKDAWERATDGMSDEEYLMHSGVMALSMHRPMSEPLEPAFDLTRAEGYLNVVDNYLYTLTHYRGMLAEGQFDRDFPFFTRFKEELAHAHETAAA